MQYDFADANTYTQTHTCRVKGFIGWSYNACSYVCDAVANKGILLLIYFAVNRRALLLFNTNVVCVAVDIQPFLILAIISFKDLNSKDAIEFSHKM